MAFCEEDGSYTLPTQDTLMHSASCFNISNLANFCQLQTVCKSSEYQIADRKPSTLFAKM